MGDKAAELMKILEKVVADRLAALNEMPRKRAKLTKEQRDKRKADQEAARLERFETSQRKIGEKMGAFKTWKNPYLANGPLTHAVPNTNLCPFCQKVFAAKKRNQPTCGDAACLKKFKIECPYCDTKQSSGQPTCGADTCVQKFQEKSRRRLLERIIRA